MDLQLQNIANKYHNIYTFERLDDGTLKIREHQDFYPYYYEPALGGDFKTYDGKRARKIVVSNPGDIAKQRTEQSYESDIAYPKRYLIDEVDTILPSKPKYLFIDIEIKAKDFPDITKAEDPISCVTIYNSYAKEYITWYSPEWGDEWDMLEDVVHYIKTEEPDLFMAWNVDFDYTYLVNRLEKDGVNFAEAISPISQNRMGKNGVFYPAGISIVDYMGLYEKVTLGKKRSYALDYIAQEDLGEESWGNATFGEINAEIKAKNINDIKRMVALEAKYKLIPHFDEIRRFAKCYWEDLPNEHVTRDGKTMVVSNNSKVIDMILLEEARKLGVLLPKKTKDSEKDEFEGAYRDTLKTGVFKDLGKYDLSGAYLYAITDLCLDTNNILDTASKNTLPVVITDRKTNDAVKTLHLLQKEDALLPTVIRKLVIERNKYRELLKSTSMDAPEYEMIEQKYKAMKGLVLSAWGVIGLQYFRLYDSRIASMITSIVRDLLRYVVTECNKLGHDVVYIDTDSVFLIDKGKNINVLLNELVQRWSQERYKKASSIGFEYEGHFEKILILTKCHYYGYLKSSKGSKKEIKGLEVKRSSSSKYEAQFQDTLINKILNTESLGKIIQWITDETTRIKTLPLKEIGFPCKIMGEYTKSEPIFVRAYANSQALMKGFKLNKGELFHYIFIKSKGLNKTGKELDVIGITEDTDLSKYGLEVNYDEVIRRTIVNKTENIFEVLGWGSITHILTGQTSLF